MVSPAIYAVFWPRTRLRDQTSGGRRRVTTGPRCGQSGGRPHPRTVPRPDSPACGVLSRSPNGRAGNVHIRGFRHQDNAPLGVDHDDCMRIHGHPLAPIYPVVPANRKRSVLNYRETNPVMACQRAISVQRTAGNGIGRDAQRPKPHLQVLQLPQLPETGGSRVGLIKVENGGTPTGKRHRPARRDRPKGRGRRPHGRRHRAPRGRLQCPHGATQDEQAQHPHRHGQRSPASHERGPRAAASESASGVSPPIVDVGGPVRAP